MFSNVKSVVCVDKENDSKCWVQSHIISCIQLSQVWDCKGNQTQDLNSARRLDALSSLL